MQFPLCGLVQDTSLGMHNASGWGRGRQEVVGPGGRDEDSEEVFDEVEYHKAKAFLERHVYLSG